LNYFKNLRIKYIVFYFNYIIKFWLFIYFSILIN
jgi:hypothetical protein